MSESISITEEKDYLHIVMLGATTNFTEITQSAENIIDKSRKQGYTRILIDESNALITVDTLDNVRLAERLVQNGIPGLGFRVAMLCNEKNCIPMSSLETALQNRSINFKTFQNIDSAKAWLIPENQE